MLCQCFAHRRSDLHAKALSKAYGFNLLPGNRKQQTHYSLKQKQQRCDPMGRTTCFPPTHNPKRCDNRNHALLVRASVDRSASNLRSLGGQGTSDLYSKQETKIQDVRAKHLYSDRSLITWSRCRGQHSTFVGYQPCRGTESSVNKTQKRSTKVHQRWNQRQSANTSTD